MSNHIKKLNKTKKNKRYYNKKVLSEFKASLSNYSNNELEDMYHEYLGSFEKAYSIFCIVDTLQEKELVDQVIKVWGEDIPHKFPLVMFGMNGKIVHNVEYVLSKEEFDRVKVQFENEKSINKIMIAESLEDCKKIF